MNDTRLYISNLDRLATVEDLESIFSTCGDVGRIRVRNDTCVVEMLSVSQARRARRDLDGMVLWGRSMRVISANEAPRGSLRRVMDRIFRQGGA